MHPYPKHKTPFRWPLPTTIITLLMMFALAQPLASREGQTTAYPSGDEMQFSLLTCGQGEAIYALFGHTAIRYRHAKQGVDIVFNYGVFDFDTPNFALRFALGETDYLLAINEFPRFLATYQYNGRSVSEQVLNLTAEEKLRLLALLEENYRPENRVYRYNFFFDNCATRPRNLIEKAINGRITYHYPKQEPITFRQLLHHYSQNAYWSDLGMSLCLGREADRHITPREMEFVPFCLRDDMRSARIEATDGTSRPLVLSEKILVDLPEMHPDEGRWNIPLIAAITLLLLVIGLTGGEMASRRHPLSHPKALHNLWWLDLPLLLGGGLLGLTPAFLSLFSSHPCVDSNWLLLAFHPGHLLALTCVIRRIKKGAWSRYQLGNFCLLTLFIIVILLKIQIIPGTAVYLALCLWVRAGANLYLTAPWSAQNHAKKALRDKKGN